MTLLTFMLWLTSYNFYVTIGVRVKGPQGGTNTTNASKKCKYPIVHEHMLQNKKCNNVAPTNMHLIRWIIKTWPLFKGNFVDCARAWISSSFLFLLMVPVHASATASSPPLQRKLTRIKVSNYEKALFKFVF